MMIKDLEISKELSGKDLAAVRGGFTMNASQFGYNEAVQGGGVIIGSPVFASYTGTQNQTGAQAQIASLVNSLGLVYQV
ncbi:MAG: hypothetical protein ACRD8O_02420 [Bryobacteraceae bacterium]